MDRASAPSSADEVGYLDNAATTWPKPEAVYRAMEHYSRDLGANPGRSGHRRSVAAARVVYRARSLVARLFHMDDPARVIFTLNCTAALNGALNSLVRPGTAVLTTTLEHNSVMRPLRYLETTAGITVLPVPVSAEGEVDRVALAAALSRDPSAVVVTHASNVTGTVVDLAPFAEAARQAAVPLIVDGAQSAGSVALDLEGMGISVLCFSGHKGLCGPQGTGGLCLATGVELTPWVRGGTGSRSEEQVHPTFLPDALEAGTPNAPGLAGLAAGVEYVLERGLDSLAAHESALVAWTLEKLESLPRVRVLPPGVAKPRTGVLSFQVEGLPCSEVSRLLDERHRVLTRPGLHCAPLAHEHLGTAPEGTVRVSYGPLSTRRDAQQFVAGLTDVLTK